MARAGVQLDDRLRVGRRVGVQAAEEAELVGVPGHVREQLRDPGARLAVLGELELRRGQRAAAGADLAVVLLQLRLVLEGVHLRHRPFHEQEDDPLRLGGEVRLPPGASGVGSGLTLLRRAGRRGRGSRSRRRRT